MTSYIFPKSDLGGAHWKVDEHFTVEYEAASRVAPVALVDSYSLQNKARIQLPESFSSPVIYRGWMLTGSEYRELERALTQRGFKLITDSKQYLRAHEIDGWIDALGDHTPSTVVLPMNVSKEELLETVKKLPKDDGLFIKGVSKSNSGLTKVDPDEDLSEGLKRFRDLEYLNDSDQVAIRSFIPLDKSFAELRGWWANGEFVTVKTHPNFRSVELKNPAKDDDLLTKLVEKMRHVGEALKDLQLKFCTVDFAVSELGEIIVIEVGDGQVSGIGGPVEDLVSFYQLLTEVVE